jgi:hypothetical protein
VKKGLRPAVEPQATSEPNAALAPEATSASVLDLYLFASHDRLQNRPGGDGQRGPVQVHAQAGSSATGIGGWMIPESRGSTPFHH